MSLQTTLDNATAEVVASAIQPVDFVIPHLNEYWQEAYDHLQANPKGFAIVGGRFYSIGDEKAERKGFYGRLHCIKFFDGRLLKSTNLWNGSPIPEESRPLLPD